MLLCKNWPVPCCRNCPQRNGSSPLRSPQCHIWLPYPVDCPGTAQPPLQPGFLPLPRRRSCFPALPLPVQLPSLPSSFVHVRKPQPPAHQSVRRLPGAPGARYAVSGAAASSSGPFLPASPGSPAPKAAAPAFRQAARVRFRLYFSQNSCSNSLPHVSDSYISHTFYKTICMKTTSGIFCMKI